ncbi:Transcriptional activator of fatty acid utilization [Entomortierella lignicola]|nr:Transcriptional activator of fatty acid utilization [Entomortierella lignicola]
MNILLRKDIGLHRNDTHLFSQEEAEIRKRVWWALYITDRIGSGTLGRPTSLRDDDFNIDLPSQDWITKVVDDTIEHPYESERLVSSRLLWSCKLFILMGKVLSTMHSMEVELNNTLLRELSKSQLSHLHNSLSSWLLALPTELLYTPYTMSPGINNPPPAATALMHMFYYTCLIILHRPYMRLSTSLAIDDNLLDSSRNICTAAATNICHIADSLMINGQLRDTCYYGMTCLLAAGNVHIHSTLSLKPSDFESTYSGMTKTVDAALELAKTFPFAESFIAMILDAVESQSRLLPSADASIDASNIVAPFANLMSPRLATHNSTFKAPPLAKMTNSEPTPSPSMQFRHPYGTLSTLLPEIQSHQSPSELIGLWRAHIKDMVGTLFKAAEGGDHQVNQQFLSTPSSSSEISKLRHISSIYPSMNNVVDPALIPPEATSEASTPNGGGVSFNTTASLESEIDASDKLLVFFSSFTSPTAIKSN